MACICGGGWGDPPPMEHYSTFRARGRARAPTWPSHYPLIRASALAIEISLPRLSALVIHHIPIVSTNYKKKRSVREKTPFANSRVEKYGPLLSPARCEEGAERRPPQHTSRRSACASTLHTRGARLRDPARYGASSSHHATRHHTMPPQVPITWRRPTSSCPLACPVRP